MPKLRLNDNVELEYEHVPIYASSNAISGTRYVTKLFIFSTGNRYELGSFDGKLDEEAIKINFEDIIRDKQRTQYGQQTTALRKDLEPRTDGRIGNASQQLGHRDMRGKSILNRND